MSRFLSTIACAALLAAGCGSNPAEPEIPFPVTMTIQAGTAVTTNGLFVKFTEVSNDFRCPINALCVDAGDAHLEFDFSIDGRFEHKRLQVFNSNLRFATFEGYTIEVKELTPGRDMSRPMEPSDYRAKLVISR